MPGAEVRLPWISVVVTEGMLAVRAGAACASLPEPLRTIPRSALEKMALESDRVSRARADADPRAAVESDGVRRAGDRAADRVARGVAVDRHAVSGVADQVRTAGVRADEVAPQDIAGGARTAEMNAVAVAGDDVPRAGGGAADEVGGGILNPDAVGGVAQGSRAI